MIERISTYRLLRSLAAKALKEALQDLPLVFCGGTIE